MSNPPIVPVLEALHSDFKDAGLRTWGRWTPVKCAFHQERHASASYNPDEGVFKCHACGIGGDAYQIVMEVERVDFPTAKQRVADILGDSSLALRGQSSDDSPGSRRSRLPRSSGDSAARRAALQARGRGRRLARSR